MKYMLVLLLLVAASGPARADLIHSERTSEFGGGTGVQAPPIAGNLNLLALRAMMPNESLDGVLRERLERATMEQQAADPLPDPQRVSRPAALPGSAAARAWPTAAFASALMDPSTGQSDISLGVSKLAPVPERLTLGHYREAANPKVLPAPGAVGLGIVGLVLVVQIIRRSAGH